MNKYVVFRSLIISLLLSFPAAALSIWWLHPITSLSDLNLYLSSTLLFFFSIFGGNLLSLWLSPSRFYRRRFLQQQANQAAAVTATEPDAEEDANKERGTVKWFDTNKGYGFIQGEDGQDIFVHFRAIRSKGHKSLSEGQKVRFRITQGNKGPQADDVTIQPG